MSQVGRDAWAIADDVRAGRVTARDVLDEHLAVIEAANPALNAVCYLDADAARTSSAIAHASRPTWLTPRPPACAAR